jgi:hypothetical protein
MLETERLTPMQFLYPSYLKIFWAIIGSLLFAQQSLAQNKATCVAMAAEMNKSLPVKIDALTILQSTSCVEDLMSGQIHFQYFHTISNPSVLPQDVQRKAKTSAKNQYCNNKGFRTALRYYVFDFNYFDSNRQLLYSFSIKNSDC